MNAKIIAWYNSLSLLNQLTIKYAWEMCRVIFRLISGIFIALTVMVISDLIFNTVLWGLGVNILLWLLLIARMEARDTVIEIEEDSRYKTR